MMMMKMMMMMMIIIIIIGLHGAVSVNPFRLLINFYLCSAEDMVSVLLRSSHEVEGGGWKVAQAAMASAPPWHFAAAFDVHLAVVTATTQMMLTM